MRPGLFGRVRRTGRGRLVTDYIWIGVFAVLNASEKYLASYKKYETLLRSGGTEPKQVEDELSATDPSTAARLRMCRLFRNYLSHENDPGFLEPTVKMQAFLDKRVFDLESRGDVVKKHLKPAAYGVFEPTAKLGDVLEKLCSAKRDMAASRVDGKWVLYGIHDLTALYVASRAARLKAAKCLKAKPAFAGPMDDFSSLDSTRFVVCTDDGTPDGTVLGVLKF